MPDRRLRVLVADDDPGVVKAVSRLLSLRFEVVGSVADGSQLVPETLRLRPDVVVLDVHLDSSDGLAACRQITQALPGLKVVMFTAVDDEELKRRAFEAGAHDFVRKLAVDEDLFSAIERLDAGRDGDEEKSTA